MENLSDYLHKKLETMDLESADREELIAYINEIVSKTKPVYGFLSDLENDNVKKDIVIEAVRKMIRGEDV
jgi:hypothetical protein